MDVRSELTRIHTNRLMQTEKEISEFKEALSNLIALGDVSIIDELCMAFDDDTEQHEIMFGLIHGIERLYRVDVEEGLYLIALVIPSVIDRAREWMAFLHYRILNHEQVRSVYRSVLSKLDGEKKQVVIDLLKDIKCEDPVMFGGSVDEVLSV
ncbi:hypothetical protein HXA34_20485 [Salipaludibacillus agaradhaerens]|uniref:Imm30 family immunity protein n=1 Tax=Salipaludibacillus agaradhaerens TaxID=76935 RepID=UPI002150BCDD|nr:Imm30 family immunity protein [Salipaludibacillus agaradhaerens]MCR6108676.1 hypothetical protein [Salipaludibacillus agaradhaerens]MCR6120700.1 hypothetical protein [Salipaludibacillus agaradhaerens]